MATAKCGFVMRCAGADGSNIHVPAPGPLALRRAAAAGSSEAVRAATMAEAAAREAEAMTCCDASTPSSPMDT
eukprot:1122183-Alexandrium_andersonii.AAC.1